jgi:hypothetical protein
LLIAKHFGWKGKCLPGYIQTLPRIYFVTKTIPMVCFTKPNITQHRNKIPPFEVVSRVAVVTWPPNGKWRRWSIVFSDDCRDPG